MSAMFPFGLVLCKMMNIHLLSTDNPLSVLGGMIAVAQAFFIPVFILVYRHMPEYLPFTIGLLGGSHFLPYMWIYRSKAYLFITLGTCSSALILGGYFVEQAFTLVPLATSIVYAIGILLIFKELKTYAV